MEGYDHFPIIELTHMLSQIWETGLMAIACYVRVQSKNVCAALLAHPQKTKLFVTIQSP